MIDRRLRAAKDQIIEPLASRLPDALTASHLTALALAGSIAAGLLAAAGWRWWALAAWIASRIVDGTDGHVARRRQRQSDLGGYLDLMGDTVGYAVVPLAIAAGQDSAGVWMACAVLLASFYVNAVSWTLLSAIAEKRGAGAGARGEQTSLHMPSGLVEGAETIVLFGVMLALPGQAETLFWAMAVLVVVGALQRVVWASRSLR